LAASLLLLAPYLPLLFMGEEYGEEHPFQFFCSFSDPKLIDAVRNGRRREFEAFQAIGGDVPDPQAETTFAASHLTWSWESDQHKSGLRRLYQDLLRARREWPALRDYSQRSARLLPDIQSGVILELVRGGRRPDAGGTIQALFNLTAQPQITPFRSLAPVQWTSEAERYHGGRKADVAKESLLPYECMVFGSTH
jgi:maltooligosyltrehalose trehalohydrolase